MLNLFEINMDEQDEQDKLLAAPKFLAFEFHAQTAIAM
jgi:hypothetical protein